MVSPPNNGNAKFERGELCNPSKVVGHPEHRNSLLMVAQRVRQGKNLGCMDPRTVGTASSRGVGFGLRGSITTRSGIRRCGPLSSTSLWSSLSRE
ncbi:hypothetical protein M407DRAFT_242583 [Tulasnella calospora MUT 4182]|uniref:Uncharacterized protein n=1 Tax=Tulasnella calospora MUT 4182 TaxID=1051891 RepID=A0A0C3QPX4_9AGAM|nr:hypothetical protein M407DRAFT_242583 [Tulasnella calospora MUT 4182]